MRYYESVAGQDLADEFYCEFRNYIQQVSQDPKRYSERKGLKEYSFHGRASSMMLDFKCIISPYNVYVNDRDWESSGLSQAATDRISKSMHVFAELTSLLKHRTYKSGWEI